MDTKITILIDGGHIEEAMRRIGAALEGSLSVTLTKSQARLFQMAWNDLADGRPEDAKILLRRVASMRKASRAARERDQARLDAGLVRGKTGLGRTIWE